MPSSPLIGAAFTSYEMRLAEVVDYTAAVMPYIVEKPTSLRVFIEGSIVLSVAHLEDFLQSLVGTAAPQREPALRKYLSERGNDADRTRAKTCDLVALVRMAKNRLSFKKNGASIIGIFDAVFGSAPWPSDGIRDVILDLVRLRNMIVHAGSAEVGIGSAGQYAKQLSRAEVLTIQSYGDFTTSRVNPLKALYFYREALIALQAQVNHLREHLLKKIS